MSVHLPGVLEIHIQKLCGVLSQNNLSSSLSAQPVLEPEFPSFQVWDEYCKHVAMKPVS